jgi:hypothetical protein
MMAAPGDVEQTTIDRTERLVSVSFGYWKAWLTTVK